jgi:hypothetical protein
MGAAPTTGAGVLANMAQAQQQRTAAQNAISGQSYDALVRSANAIKSLDPDKVTQDDLQQTAQALNQNFTSPNAQSATNQVFANIAKVFASTKPGDPLRATALNHAAMMYLPIQEQQAINTPTAVQMGNNQQTWLQNVKPGVAGIPQNSMIPNTAVQQQLSPNTPVMQGNTPGYYGPQLGGVAPGGQQQQSGFVPAGLPAGTQGNIENNVKQMNDHFSTLQDQAQGNNMVQSLRSNINGLANKAITGVENDKRSYVNGLLAVLGVPGTGDLKTDTDLMEKSLMQLNLTTPASSDAARALVSAARPNSHMTPEAIKYATDQLAAQVQANMAVRDHLAGYKYAHGGQGDAVGYQSEKQRIEKLADPRIWQYINLQPGSEAAIQFADKMSQTDKEAMRSKIHQLEELKVLKP